MTKKLFINSVKINSSNTISLPYQEFSNGFNIICGANEAGKSSMMNFLKDCFHSPAGLQGDIELTADNTKYQIKIEGNQRSVSKRHKLLAPADKTLEDILPKIDESFYRTAFTINLDDIKNINTKLFDIIQDHNADKVRLCKSKLESETKAFLTEGGKATKEITRILNEIKKLDKTTNELVLKEKDYYDISNSLKSTELDLAELCKKIENKKQVQLEKQIISRIEEIKTKIASISPNFNQKLSDNKHLFYEINNKTALIIKNIEEHNELINSKLNSKIDELLANIEQNYNLKLDKTTIENINISREFESSLRNLQTELNNQELLIKELENKRDLSKKSISSYEQDLSELEEEIKKLGITDITALKEGLQELRDAISSLAELTNTMPAKNTKLANIIYCIASIILIGCGLYLHNIQGIVMGAIGALILIPTIKVFISPNKTNSTEHIYNYIQKEIFPKLNREEKCLQTIPALSTIASIEEGKLKDYDRLFKDWEKKSSEIKNINNEKTEIENELNIASEVLTNIDVKIKSLATINNKVFSIDIVFELINDIKEVRELITKFHIENDRRQFLQQEIENFMKEFKSFLEQSNLDANIDINTLQAKIQSIIATIDSNEKYKHELETLMIEQKDLDSKLNTSQTVDLSPNDNLQDLENELNNLNITLGTIKEKKRELEDFEGIISIQNEKNILKNQLQYIIEETFKKKLAINIIKHAEKTIRQTEPNLVNAENLLRLLTNSKYIGADYATRTITSANGELKTEDELSRGTREQLYLAFRLGYAQNYGSDGTNYRLPLIIDDAFVNFDKERLTSTLNALKEFAKTNQVLFFTCHKDYITSLINTNDVNIIDLNND